jgi:sodium/hydrogen antiporter
LPDFLIAFGIVAVVLTVASLVSGVVERAPISFPILFLGLGFLVGEQGLGVLEMGPHDEKLEIVATLTLALVLFLDAVRLNVRDLGRRWLVPFLILGPGTALIIVLGAVPLALMLGFGWILAFIGGAVLASTDPVILRDVIRDRRIPQSVRQVLKIEAGMNDLVVLPVILVLIAVALNEVGGGTLGWLDFMARLLLLGPAIGFAIGGLGSWLMSRVERSVGVRREYQALYGVGLVLAAYTAATAAGGDGFLGAFAAGAAVVLLNQTLCDCFLDYGEVTSEMAMLLAFVLFGSVLSGILSMADLGLSLALAALVIFGIRPLVLGIVLSSARMSWEARGFISWFGPRGLNSLLLALIAVAAGVPGAEVLMATVGIVVLASAAIHGASTTPVAQWYERRVGRKTLEEERETTAAGLFAHDEDTVHRIGPVELKQRVDEGLPTVILDVRSRSGYEADPSHIPGGERVLPDEALDWAHARANSDGAKSAETKGTEGTDERALIVTYCA